MIPRKKCPRCQEDLERVTLRVDTGWSGGPDVKWVTCKACNLDRIIYIPGSGLAIGGTAEVVIHMGGELYDIDNPKHVGALAFRFGKRFVEYLQR